MSAKQEQIPAGASASPSFFGALVLALAFSILLWVGAIAFYFCANLRP